MPEITVTEQLYRQLEAEADGQELESALWEMVGRYRREHNPGD